MNCNIDITGVVLKTERLVLREWRLSDLEDFYEYCSVDGVGQMAGWLPHKNREESLRILNHFIDGKHTFALEYQGKVIGSLGLEAYTEDEYPENRICSVKGLLGQRIDAGSRKRSHEIHV